MKKEFKEHDESINKTVRSSIEHAKKYYVTDNTDKYELAVESILCDLIDRRGIRYSWYDINEDIQKEIKETWRRIIKTTIEN